MKRLLGIILCSCSTIVSFTQERNLDYFINRAITNSPLLKDYQNQLLSLSLDSQIVRAGMKPQVNGVSNNNYAPVINGWGYDEVITNGQQVSAMVSVNKAFVSNKTLAAQINNLNIQSQATVNNGRISEQDLKKMITDQYIIVYGDQLQLEFTRHINGILRREDTLLKKLTQDNVYKQADYLTFRVLLEQQSLNASQLEVQYNFDYTTLSYMAGVVDTAVTRVEDPKLSVSNYRDFAGSVFYKQFVLDSLRLVNERSLVDVNYRPKINAFADAGYNSSLIYKPYMNVGTNIGLTLAIPIYDGKQRKLQYSKIDVSERTRIARRDFFVQQHDQQLLQLEQQLRLTERLVAQINKQVTYTETLITVTEKLLATGDAQLVDFIIALNTYFTAKNLVAQNYVSRMKIINQMNYWVR